MLSLEELEVRQAALPSRDVRDIKTGDEEESDDGLEESERLDEEALSATEAHTVEELRAELAEVQSLVRLARQVYDRKQESKFERLWQALEDHPDTKVLIFTEFRDTVGVGIQGDIEGVFALEKLWRKTYPPPGPSCVNARPSWTTWIAGVAKRRPPCTPPWTACAWDR